MLKMDQEKDDLLLEPMEPDALDLADEEELSDEEFLKQKPNINIPSIGKLYVTLDKYQRMKRQYAYYQNLKKNNYVTH